jgi:hypothetical protein
MTDQFVLDDATRALLKHAEAWEFVPNTGDRYILTDRGRVISVSRTERRRNGTNFSVQAKVLTIGRHHSTGRPRVNLNLGRVEARRMLYPDAAVRDMFGAT